MGPFGRGSNGISSKRRTKEGREVDNAKGGAVLPRLIYWRRHWTGQRVLAYTVACLQAAACGRSCSCSAKLLTVCRRGASPVDETLTNSNTLCDMFPIKTAYAARSSAVSNTSLDRSYKTLVDVLYIHFISPNRGSEKKHTHTLTQTNIQKIYTYIYT